ncbi:MAG TPA: sugar phosphate isomerase/epimerase [Alphaproteobacteria bacterium]|nr:sugar phosphate isomerase/epimerase [Alphaproteobacteria bacterium]
MTLLSLDHLTIFDTSPAQLIDIAAGLGIPLVSLWTQLPLQADLPLVTKANKAETLARMRDTGVKLGNMECFNLTPEVKPEDFRPAIALGAELGATSLVAINAWDPDRSHALDNFAGLCRIAAEFGMKVNVEFISMGKVRTLEDAVAFITDSGEPNVGITVDFLHLVRTGGTAADLGKVDPKLIGYVQICDGPAGLAREEWNDEGFEQRQVPGEGEFPLAALLAAVPVGVTIGVEVPQRSRREAGISAAERARLAVAGTRNLLAN